MEDDDEVNGAEGAISAAISMQRRLEGIREEMLAQKMPEFYARTQLCASAWRMRQSIKLVMGQALTTHLFGLWTQIKIGGKVIFSRLGLR